MEFYGNACQTQSSVGNSPFCEFTVEMKYMMKMIIIAIDQKIKLDDLLHFYECCYRFLDILYFLKIKENFREGQQVR